VSCGLHIDARKLIDMLVAQACWMLLGDFAEACDCSVPVASLVVSGKYEGRFNDRLKSTIEAAVIELGYRPNTSAQTLALARQKRCACSR